jgi:hypothetical protein
MPSSAKSDKASPHDRRIVDDEHLERAFRRHAVRASGRPGAPAPFGSACV